MITEIDLILEFTKDTGIRIEKEERFENMHYLHWLEHNLLELRNEKKYVEELFNEE